jgi:hypothetical protein
MCDRAAESGDRVIAHLKDAGSVSAEQPRERTKEFALRIIKPYRALPKTGEGEFSATSYDGPELPWPLIIAPQGERGRELSLHPRSEP